MYSVVVAALHILLLTVAVAIRYIRTNEKKSRGQVCAAKYILLYFRFYLHPQSVRFVRPITAETQS